MKLNIKIYFDTNTGLKLNISSLINDKEKNSFLDSDVLQPSGRVCPIIFLFPKDPVGVTAELDEPLPVDPHLLSQEGQLGLLPALEPEVLQNSQTGLDPPLLVRREVTFPLDDSAALAVSEHLTYIQHSHWSRASCTERSYYRRP